MTEFEHGLNITPQDVVDAVEAATKRSRRVIDDSMKVAAERFVWELVAPNIAIVESPFGTPTVLVPERWRYQAWPEYEQGREIL